MLYWFLFNNCNRPSWLTKKSCNVVWNEIALKCTLNLLSFCNMMLQKWHHFMSDNVFLYSNINCPNFYFLLFSFHKSSMCFVKLYFCLQHATGVMKNVSQSGLIKFQLSTARQLYTKQTKKKNLWRFILRTWIRLSSTSQYSFGRTAFLNRKVL